MLQELTPEQFESKSSAGKILILDVRTREEYDHGHLENSILIPVDQLSNRYEEILQYKVSPVLIYCRSGIRSITAGFTSVAHLTKGITGWIMAEKKVVI